MRPLTIVALNAAAYDAEFDSVRALDPGILLVHAEYRSSWAEVSARRTGAQPPEPEVLSDALRAALARADVVFGFVVPRNLPRLAPGVRWVATPATGIDHLRATGVLESDITVTTAGGHFAAVIAEHVFAGMLYFAKRLAHFERERQERHWRMTRIQSLAGQTVGLVGVGSIGGAVARLAQAFGMRVLGVGRSSPQGRRITGIDRLLSRTELPALLAASDYVVLAVAETPETRHMMGATELAAMKADAVLINVARGTVVDEAALVTALRTGGIAGAALDVFAQEPLPVESPLWALPNVLLTPHVAANVAQYLPQAIALFADNVQRFLKGAPLLSQLDRRRRY
ncbi:MAG: D-2-hydroxyacid dehydrogenase [Candidatus Binatia bacterium]